MKLAVNLWTVYGWNLPEPVSADVLRALARMGSQGVELVIDDGANSAEILLNRRQELSALLAECHLETPSIGTALFWRYNLASQDETVRRKGLDLVRDGCRVAQAYGAPVLLILAGQQEPQTEYTRSYTTSVETYAPGRADRRRCRRHVGRRKRPHRVCLAALANTRATSPISIIHPSRPTSISAMG